MARPAFTPVAPCGELTGMSVGMALHAPVEFAPAEIEYPLHLPVSGDCGMASLACHTTVFPLQRECCGRMVKLRRHKTVLGMA
jgi:hypothetical protein